MSDSLVLFRPRTAAPAQPQVVPHLNMPSGRLAARAIDWAVASTGPVRVALIVSGFWRSGTTWLQECLSDALEAKPIFEALSPQNPGWARRLAVGGVGDPDLQEAQIPGPRTPDDPLWTYLDGAFRGASTSGFGLASRHSLGQSFRRLVVAKEVRLQLNLAAAHDRYRAPVVHLRRHPCAVAASLLRADWAWSFQRVRLAELDAGFPTEARAAAARFDTDELSRIAAYWALSEAAVDRQLAGVPWGRIVTYERAVEAPETLVTHLCALSGHPQKRRPRPGRDSAVTHPDALGLAPRERRERWRNALSGADAARVEAVVAALAPDLATGVGF